MFDLNPMFNPKSIAIIGASTGAGKISAIPLENLINYGYEGEIYPVNPKYEEISGIKCVKEIKELPKSVDLAIVSVGAVGVLGILDGLKEREIKAVVVFSSGFSEVGEEGVKLQDQLTTFSNTTKIPVCGPNSLGVFNKNKGVFATFARNNFDQDHSVAFISQSGAFGTFTYEIAKEQGLGYNYFASTGNEAAVDYFDYVNYFATLNDVKVIGGYIEGARDIDKMTKAIKTAQINNKPLVIMKVGKSQAGSAAAISHTSSLVGNQSMYDSYFKQNNIVQVSNENELIDTLTVFNRVKTAPNRGATAIVTVSGGTGIVMADKCEEYGVLLADLTSETRTRLTELLPEYASIENPVDVTAQIMQQLESLEGCIKALFEDENVEAVVFYAQLAPHLAPQIVPKLIEIEQQTDKSFIVCWSGASEETRNSLIKGGICWLPTPTRTIKAISNFLHYNENKKRIINNELVIPQDSKENNNIDGILTEYTGKQLLSQYGISVPLGKETNSKEEAIATAKEIGYPVVLKVASSAIAHKSDMGGVRVNINSPDEVKEAYKEILSNTHKFNSDIKPDGILVEKMGDEGLEVFIGCFQDPLFGPCIMFGLGGIYVEILSDVSVRKAPLTKKDAEEMIKEIKGYHILKGIRGRNRSDIDALVTTLVNVSIFCWDHRNSLKELDINPLVVFEEGQGVLALDALVVGRKSKSST